MVARVRWARRFGAGSTGVVAGACFIALFLAGAPAEASMPTAAEKLVERWNEIGRKLIAIAEDLPEDKYAYKPHPDARSFVDQLLHAAGAMASFNDLVEGRPERYPCDPTGNELRTRAEVVALVRREVSAGAALLGAAGERGSSPAARAVGGAARLDDLANKTIEHSGEHYGQLVVYYRINGMVPPESR